MIPGYTSSQSTPERHDQWLLSDQWKSLTTGISGPYILEKAWVVYSLGLLEIPPTPARLTPSFLSGASSAHLTVWRSAPHLLWGLHAPFSFKLTRFSLLCTICATFCTICTSRTFCTGLLQLGKELSSAELVEGVEKKGFFRDLNYSWFINFLI